jgi:hypothetical protein
MNKKQKELWKIIGMAILAGFVMGWFWGAFYTQYSIQQQEHSVVKMSEPAVDTCLCYLGENSSIIMEHSQNQNLQLQDNLTEPITFDRE